ncbi:putative methyltransferase TARBP1 [Frankliniella fusca]|uniref:Methyltransferase TARBP1 n=1 Tax=Frankliniella fusca TaxID=407009 RepID=A0AAE1LR47_9NEOP|nr:putative methyltransferase TARBP1 [Frankliniella fusca]
MAPRWRRAGAAPEPLREQVAGALEPRRNRTAGAARPEPHSEPRWSRAGAALPCWSHAGAMLEPCWSHAGVALESRWTPPPSPPVDVGRGSWWAASCNDALPIRHPVHCRQDSRLVP